MSQFKERPDQLYRPRRFWTEASVGPRRDDGWPVLLDARTARTPAKAELVLPTEALARLVADEWNGVGEVVDYALMPATRLAFTAIDRVSETRAEVADEVGRYAGSDVLCYFADSPAALVDREEERWGPILTWAEQDLGLHLERASGIVHRPQSPETLARARALAAESDDFGLTGLAWAAGLLGSAVLAFALQRGRLSGADAFDLSRLDEQYQAEQWGVDAEAAERAEAHKSEALLLDRWFAALR
ncbi:ATP12 family protein [Caulobacter sp. 17J65-9]|uniref:ATP12 family chaperone protein n=1 Tax=Caulobacter sp. 17J65-9 TaxID=2709382 RepID=UPI0013CD1712|nr:ATP12 family protein [Caulobacter sp. 17J65-9]NEX92942.1 ATPase [Caulobacter sp. 17J65-9]